MHADPKYRDKAAVPGQRAGMTPAMMLPDWAASGGRERDENHRTPTRDPTHSSGYGPVLNGLTRYGRRRQVIRRGWDLDCSMVPTHRV